MPKSPTHPIKFNCQAQVLALDWSASPPTNNINLTLIYVRCMKQRTDLCRMFRLPYQEARPWPAPSVEHGEQPLDAVTGTVPPTTISPVPWRPGQTSRRTRRSTATHMLRSTLPRRMWSPWRCPGVSGLTWTQTGTRRQSLWILENSSSALEVFMWIVWDLLLASQSQNLFGQLLILEK